MPLYFTDLSIKLLIKGFSSKKGKGAQDIIQPSHNRLQFLTSVQTPIFLAPDRGLGFDPSQRPAHEKSVHGVQFAPDQWVAG